MNNVLRFLVNALHVIAFCSVIILGIIGVLYEIVGHAKFEQLLSTVGINKGFECIWIISAIMLILLITTYFIKVNYFEN